MRSIKQQTTDSPDINWKIFYRQVFALVIPMALQNLIILGGAALEETVRRISESEFGTWLWLKNKTVLGESQYQRKLILNLEYDYAMPESEKTQDALLTELAEELFQSAFAKREDYGDRKSVV